ncbi:MAG: hypothetical protein ACYC1M_15305 [Armatimonadota bacterium]
MSRINHVDLDQVNAFTQSIKQDPTASLTTEVIESEWQISDGGMQDQSKLVFDKGKTGEATTPSDGVKGDVPCADPMHYYYYGIASGYTGVFAALAASLGVKLKCLTTRVEADMSHSHAVDVSHEPVLECVRMVLRIVSDSTIAKIREVEALALKQCPAGFLCRHQIKLMPWCSVSI